MLVLNDLQFDSRVKKEAASLMARGHEVMVFATQDDGKSPGDPTTIIFFAGQNIPVHYLKGPYWGLRRTFSAVWEVSRWLLLHIIRILLLPVFILIRRDDKVAKGAPTQLATWIRARLRVVKSALGLLLRYSAVFLPSQSVFIGWNAAVVSWRPDVVHCHDLETGRLGVKIQNSLNCELVYDSHELWTERTRRKLPFFDYFHKRAETSLESKVLLRCAAAITVSPEIADHLADAYPVERQKIAVIRNKPILENCQTKQFEDLEWNFLGTGSVMYSGRIGPKRALEDLLEASATNCSALRKIYLVGYGREDYIASLFALAVQLGVELNHLPPVESEKVPAALARAEVVFVGVERASMSYEYSLPNKYFEALASGRPVVYPLLTSMARDAREFSSCVPYEPGDVEHLALALGAAAKLEVTRGEVRARYAAADWANEAKALGDLYDRLAPSDPKSVRGDF